MEERRTNNFWLVIILIVFLLTLALLVYYIRFRTSIAPKASSYNSTNIVSISNSYVFASPIRASVDSDLIRVTVFILDDEGNGIFDKEVDIVPYKDEVKTSDLEIKMIQNLTDETGKALFDISSKTAGSYTLEAVTTETKLPQKVKVVFD